MSEERYEQRLRRIAVPGGSSVQQRGFGGPQETTLVSDFLLVEVTGEGWLPFRDVFERDGKPVRDRDERLATIFLKGGRNAFDQARAVMDEGARYNIGNISRNINTPTLALAFLTERHRGRFEFKLGKRADADPGVMIEFREKGRPTFIATTGGRDLPVSGRFWINESDGTVLRSELDARRHRCRGAHHRDLPEGRRHRAVRPCSDGGTLPSAARPDGGLWRGHVFTVSQIPGQHERGAREMRGPQTGDRGPETV